MNISLTTIKKAINLTFIAIITLSAAPSYGQQHRITRQEYIKKYKDIAIAHQQKYGIPASITMAQGILESDSGNSLLSRGSNNHFGIKCKSHWTGRTFTYTDDAPDECFRAYGSVEESYADHADFLESSPRYGSLFDLSTTDYEGWAKGLKRAGYATAPDYAERLIKLIEDNKLYQLDTKGGRGEYAEAHVEERLIEERLAGEGAKAVDPNSYRVSISSYNGYNLYRTNVCLYTVAKDGDSFETLAARFELSPKRLRRNNDMKSGSLVAGDVVYLERKGSEWGGNSHSHEVAAGETMRIMSQMYGVRERSLRSLNGMKSGEPAVGTTIRLK